MIQFITLIGSGNVAHNLGLAFREAGLEVLEVVSKNIANAEILAQKLNAKPNNDLSKINQESDLYVVASSDNSIAKIASQLNVRDKLLVHTSGSIDIAELNIASIRVGSFYPLQTFTKSHRTDFQKIPICIEANDPQATRELEQLGKKISNRIIHMSSIQRQKLHLAAVFVSNFANYMQVIGQDLCEEQGIEFNLLKPLIKEVFDKNQLKSARENQTGPAMRKDSFVMEKHLQLLKNDPSLQELYNNISALIQGDFS